MAEYVEREALLAAYDATHKGTPGGARKLIEEAPCVEIVYCSECRLWTGEKCRRFSCPPWAYCYTRADDYCSGGDPK